MTTKVKVLIAAVAIAGLHQGTVANAQEVTALEEIVVTARKRTESIMDIPVSVAIVDQRLIQEANLQNINDLVNITPGLKFNSAFGRQADRPVVRGISAIQTANELAGFFIDGVYVAGSLQTLDLDSVERVEIIKGPQSATFGRRTFSGAVNYITRKPSEELSGRFKVEAGSNGYKVLSGAISDTVGNFGYRLNLRGYNYDGDFKNTLKAGPGVRYDGPNVGGEKSTSVNLALVYDFSEDTALSFNVNYVDSDDEHFAVVLQPSSDNNCFFPATPTPKQYYCGTLKTDVPIRLGGYLPANQYGTEGDLLRTYIKFDHSFGNVDLNWTSAYNESDQTSVQDVTASGLQTVFKFPGPPTFQPGFESANGWHATFDDTSKDYSHELWLSGDMTEQIRWRAGLYTYSEKSHREVYDADGSINERNGFSKDKVDNNAVMMAVDWAPVDNFTLGLELRYAEDKISTRIDDGITTTTYKDKFDSLTHRLSASWNLSDSTMLYGTWSLGVLPGEFNTNQALPEELRSVDEQELEMFELGLKSDLSDNLTLTTAIYTMEWKDQVRSEFFVINGSPVGYSANQGSSDINGVEADINWRVIESLRLSAGFSYNDTKVKNFISDDATDIAITGDGDMSGGKMPLSPAWDAYTSATHILNLSNGYQLESRLDVSYQDGRYVRVTNLAKTGDATIVNLGVALNMQDWRVGLWGKNLTNEDSVVSSLRFLEANSFFFSGTAFQSTPRRGREWGVTVSYDF